ncbi:ISAs1 family transposase [Escherichia coli]|nr:ISAs1 family transposase [Escherichia coli]EGB41265.1 PAAR domain-containing protein [Escherichia coli H120]EFH3422358.1 ISAs1 family transposase [Escherichia coli]EFH7650696.1 ISAs1 family transposase [Escherichia coli]EFN9016095.1 ISAs1 family transposase [Escherichia coli]
MSEGPGGPQGATAGGTLAMRMLSQQAMVASQMKRAANDKAIAQMLAAKKSGPPAARLGDEIQHKSFLGALAGAVLGAIVTIAEGCLIMAACATGPYALVLVPALMYASYKASDYVEEKQNQLESWINSFCDTDGAINTGSENVNINGKPAARAAVTLPPPPPPGAIPEVPQGEPSWGDIATDLLESAAEKAVPLAKAWGNAVITLTDSNAGFMDRLCAGTSLLFPAGPVLMEKELNNPEHDSYAISEKSHGREEIRLHIVCDVPDELIDFTFEWKGLKKLCVAVSFRSIIAEQKKEPEMTVRYYISSADLTAEKFATAIRNHWHVENKLHWRLDVVMNEDDCKIRRGNAAELFSGIRHIAINILTNDKVFKAGLRRKMRKAAMDRNYLASVLAGSGLS